MRVFQDPVFEFNKRIIDATHDHCVAYKINTAFYEVSGAAGWESMQKTVELYSFYSFQNSGCKTWRYWEYVALYARAFFETLSFDAVTVAPYMGEDSIRPFLEYEDKWTILLGLTSNPGAADFELADNVRMDVLFESVIRKAITVGNN